MQAYYLPLTEYSSKHKVSISTLRRRIKTEDIEYKFEDGKYLIFDGPISSQPKVHRPSPEISEKTFVRAPALTPIKALPAPATNVIENSVISSVNQMLAELKKAYSSVLQEKEEQILFLKQEMADIKTLVKVLETENDRLMMKYNN
jgi:hypothetical protein